MWIMSWKRLAKAAAEVLRHDIDSSERTNPKWCGYLLGGLKVAIIILILAVVGGVWILAIQKQYKKAYTGLPGTTANVNGVATANLTTSNYEVTFDARDTVVPANENNAFFITTNPIITSHQVRGECAEQSRLDNVTCSEDADCTHGRIYLGGHGVSTGECNLTAGTCAVHAWCPIEVNRTSSDNNNVLQGVSDFTVLIKNYAYFPEFNKTLSNVKNIEDDTYLDRCIFDTVDDPLCPVFKFGFMIHEALKKKGSQNQQESYEQIATKGGVINIKISWNCDFDLPLDDCVPTYDFDRLDAGERNTISQGYYVKHATIFRDSNGKEYRRLITAYGVRFLITVEAKAVASHLLTGILAFGSALAYSSPLIAAIALIGNCFQKKESKIDKPDGMEMEVTMQSQSNIDCST